MADVRVFIKKVNILSFVDFLELAREVRKRREVVVDANHVSFPPEFDNGAIIGKHNLIISIKDRNTKEDIGTCEATILSIVMGENTNEIYEAWKENYNNLPGKLRDEIEAKITWALIPPVSILFEKMGLPPVVPPLILSPRTDQ